MGGDAPWQGRKSGKNGARRALEGADGGDAFDALELAPLPGRGVRQCFDMEKDPTAR